MELEVETTNGTVRGRERRGVALFAGMPYAAAPTGDRRWAAPEPPQAWEGVRDATRFGPAAPQLPGDGLTSRVAPAWDEDCLSVNVCTPSPDDAARAVMVWIHGGAYHHGTGATPWYDGTSFAVRGDIVVVTINYRLGALGFCRMPGAPSAGLNGTLDQIAALEWVQDNIARFGGDPGRVTIAGESAGAFSVSTLSVMESAAGLFGQVIAQSGAGHHVLDSNVAETVSGAFLEELGVADLTAARRCTPLEVLEAQQRVEDRAPTLVGSIQDPFYPSVHAELLPGRPVDLMAGGAGSGLKMVTGTNGDETALFGVGQVAEDKLTHLMANYADPPDALLAMYADEHPGTTAGETAVRMTTDYLFRIPAVAMAEAREINGADTWMYLFDWKSRAFDGALGASHVLETPFMFNTLDRPGVDLLLGTSDLPFALADQMHDSWIAFIRSGDPTTAFLADWPPYRPGHRWVMEFSDDPGLRRDPGRAARHAWDGLR